MKTDGSAPSPAPFFIIGCVRSGTTMLRNILRLHPNLACPEETHFFRWSEPFRGPAYRQVVLNNPTLKRHRQLDGISEAAFAEMLNSAVSRSDLCRQYMAHYLSLAKPGATRWFDKSPQNAYGAAMMATEFPRAKFVHIVRDPVNVAASLRIGKVMKIDDLIAACSYWNEAIANLGVLKRAHPGRVLTLNYESFTANPAQGIAEVLAFLGEDHDPAHFASVVTREVSHEESGVLSPEELVQVRQLCLAGRLQHGYATPEELEDKVRRRAERQTQAGERAAAKRAAKAVNEEASPALQARKARKAKKGQGQPAETETSAQKPHKKHKAAKPDL